MVTYVAGPGFCGNAEFNSLPVALCQQVILILFNAKLQQNVD